MKDLILVGASGLAREVISASQNDYRVVGIVDDDADLHGTFVGGVEVLGAVAPATEFDALLLICIGSGQARRSVASRLASLGVADDRFATVVDGSVRVPPTCSIGVGSILLAQVALTDSVGIGRHVVLMPNVTATHDDRLGDFATLTAGVSLGGSVSIGDGAYVGMNASIRQGVTIGVDSIVGMGAAVLHDVPAGEVWAGVPARSIADRRRA